MTKQRADQLLAERGLAASRTDAQRLIMAGRVTLASGERVHKAGHMLPLDADVRVAPADGEWFVKGNDSIVTAAATGVG